MKEINLAKLDDAFKLITTKPLLVFILAVPSINHLLIHTKSSLLLKINFVFILTGVFAVPVIYGIFLDAIKGGQVLFSGDLKKIYIELHINHNRNLYTANSSGICQIFDGSVA